MAQNITPGPWMAYPRNVDNDGTQDELCGSGWEIDGPPEPQLRGQFSRAADAYLIAAAPELLEACIAVEQLAALAEFPSDEWIVAGRQLAQIAPLLRAAIAKATHTKQTATSSFPVRHV